MTQPCLTDITARIQELPAISGVTLDLLRSLNDGEADIDALSRRISQDQAIAARVLRVANSPFYGLQMKVGSLHDAIVVLGFSTVRSLVVAASVVCALPTSRCPGFDAARFWRHGVGTAAAAQALARALGRNPDTSFVAGLLHDIGRLVLVVLLPAEYAQLLQQSRQEDRRLVDVEQEVLGFDHAGVGAALAQRWNFPDAIREALAYHHQPDPAAGHGLASLIHYADAIAQALDLDEAEDSQMPHLDQAAVDALGLDRQALNTLLAETRVRFDSYRLML